MSKIESAVEVITPAKARQYLDNQINNRAIVENHVEWLASLMARGEFVVSQAITFDEKDRLLDGQHRLAAVVRYGKPVTFLVVRGVSSKTFSVMDTGRGRKGHDVLSIRGRTGTRLLAAVLRLVWQDELGFLGSNQPEHRPSNSDLLDRDAEHPEIGDSVIRAISASRYSRCAPIAFLYWRTHRANRTVAEAFWPNVISGENLKRGTPAYLLHSLLIQQRTDGRRMNGRELLAYAIKAWNYALLSEEDCPAALRWAAGIEEFPAICATRAEAERFTKNARRSRRERAAS